MVQVTPPPDTGAHARVGLDALFDPRSVAVVGASDNPEKWGYWLASGALSGRDRRAVHLVNHRGGALDGEPFLPDLASLPVPPSTSSSPCRPAMCGRWSRTASRRAPGVSP